MTTTKTFWICYDLGLRGDYTGLYAWLDSHKAKECGDSLAVFEFDCGAHFIEEIKSELTNKVKFNKEDRIYLIWKDPQKDLIKGRFIIGQRKPAPWEGFAVSKEQGVEDVSE